MRDEAFIEVAQCGSFTAAAERLALTRSAIGKAISRLEERLDVQLLERSTRSIRLTAQGERFLARSLAALAELESAQNELLDQKNALAGPLRIALPTLFGRRWIMPSLLELARQHPGLQFEVLFANEVQDLPAERIDLAVRIGPLPDSSQLVARSLGVQSVVLCAAPALLASLPPILTATQLADVPCIVSFAGQRWPLFNAAGEIEDFALGSVIALNDAEAMLCAALQGLGVARLPDWLAADAIAAGLLVPLLPDAVPTGRPIHLLWPARPYEPRRLRLVIDTLVTRCQACIRQPAQAN